MDMEKIWKADISTMSTKTNKRAQEKYQEGAGDLKCGAQKH